jgi:hypothetical protein
MIDKAVEAKPGMDIQFECSTATQTTACTFWSLNDLIIFLQKLIWENIFLVMSKTVSVRTAQFTGECKIGIQSV